MANTDPQIESTTPPEAPKESQKKSRKLPLLHIPGLPVIDVKVEHEELARAIWDAYQVSPALSEEFAGVSWESIKDNLMKNKSAATVYVTGIMEAIAVQDVFKRKRFWENLRFATVTVMMVQILDHLMNWKFTSYIEEFAIAGSFYLFINFCAWIERKTRS